MKLLLSILLFVPVLCGAQAMPAMPASVTCLRYDTLEVSGPLALASDEDSVLINVKTAVHYRGHVAFKTGFTEVDCRSALSNKARKQLDADDVTITCLYYPVLQGDHLSINTTTLRAVLSGHIVIQEHGTRKTIGSSAVLDLSKDKYRIVSVK